MLQKAGFASKGQKHLTFSKKYDIIIIMQEVREYEKQIKFSEK